MASCVGPTPPSLVMSSVPVPVVSLGCAPDPDDPPCAWSVRWQCNPPSSVLLGMTDDAGSLQYLSRSQIIGRLTLQCVSQGAIDSFFGHSGSGGS